MAYGEKVLDHYENPRNVGKMDADSDDVGTGMVGAPACGDVMRLQIKVDDAGIIEDAKFKTYGCQGSTSQGNQGIDRVVRKNPIIDIHHEQGSGNGQQIDQQGREPRFEIIPFKSP